MRILIELFISFMRIGGFTFGGGYVIVSLLKNKFVDEDEEIRHRQITKGVENAQKRIESRNFSSRKSLIEYDDVNNMQREVIYAQRDAILKNENLKKDDVSAEHQEAIASRIYFQELYSNSFKRFDEDGVNSALNYGYMILRAIISSKIVAKGFHPSLGLHHKSQFNAYNFSDDIIEIFRPMVDYLVYMYKDILNEVKLSKEIRQKILLVAQQKVLFNNKKYDFFQAVDYYLDSIRNYFVKDEEVIIPTLSVMDYEY